MAAYPPDYLVDRRALSRKLTRWRVATLAVVALALLGAGVFFSGAGRTRGFLDAHVARITIAGIITGDRDMVRLIRDVADSRAAAVLVAIESPGGTTAGSERLYDELRRLSAKKPVAVTVGGMAASGGYIAALGGDRIFVEQNSLVGSIGVLFQYPNVSKLLDTVGVKVEEVKSSPLKAAPNGFEPTSEAARQALASLVQDSFDWFKGLVKERRKLTDEELARVADGRVFTGRQALPLKLVDAVGGEREAIAWFEGERGVARNLPVREWRKRSAERLGFLSLAAGGAEAFGLSRLAAILRADELVAGAKLDGLLAVWQGP